MTSFTTVLKHFKNKIETGKNAFTEGIHSGFIMLLYTNQAMNFIHRPVFGWPVKIRIHPLLENSDRLLRIVIDVADITYFYELRKKRQ